MSSRIPISMPGLTAEAASSLKTSLTRVSTSLSHTLSKARPWTELVDRNAFSKPDTLAESASRVRKNFNYFRVNYLIVLALVLAVSLITHPFSLLTLLCLLSAWLFLYVLRPSDQPVVIGGRTFSERETLGGLVLVTVVMVFVTSVGSLLMWSVAMGMGIVCGHGAFRVPEDLFMDDGQDMLSSGGLFSVITGNASSAAAAAVASSVVSRV